MSADNKSIIRTEKLNLFYGGFRALKDIDLGIASNRITAMIGPSGCGKSTLLRVFNRMNDTIEGIKITGKVFHCGDDIYNSNTDVDRLRRRVGMVFQRPNPFPLSIYENVAFGLKIHNAAKKINIDCVVEESLKSVLLWEELKDRLKKSALNLSLEQKQRLCIARLVAVKPDVILLDEPCSTLDPMATLKIEELMVELKKKYTIIIVTHNMQQAARVSDDTGFMLLGDLVEFGLTAQIFTAPKLKKTEDYITGRFG
jgi:phosphate transport system ATP-binding protein